MLEAAAQPDGRRAPQQRLVVHGVGRKLRSIPRWVPVHRLICWRHYTSRRD